MCKPYLKALLLLCLFCPEIQADDQGRPISINLGGLRKATAVLTDSPSEYVIKVHMLPVQCFDVITNARLNRDKGRELALQALAKYLSGKRSAEFLISGAQIEKIGTHGKFYTLEMRVPRKGVSLVRKQAPPSTRLKQGEEKVSFTSELFTCKRDYLNTLEKLSTGITIDLQSIQDKKTDEDFSVAVADVEELGLKNLENLGKEFESCNLLTFFEKDELKTALDKQKASFMEKLQQIVKQHNSKENEP